MGIPRTTPSRTNIVSKERIRSILCWKFPSSKPPTTPEPQIELIPTEEYNPDEKDIESPSTPYYSPPFSLPCTNTQSHSREPPPRLPSILSSHLILRLFLHLPLLPSAPSEVITRQARRAERLRGGTRPDRSQRDHALLPGNMSRR